MGKQTICHFVIKWLARRIKLYIFSKHTTHYLLFRLFGHSILFSVDPEEAYNFRSVLLPLFSPDAFSGCNKDEQNRANSDQQKGCWYNTITKDICDSWLKAEIDPYVKKATSDSNHSSAGTPILLYEAFKRFASQWVSFNIIGV